MIDIPTLCKQYGIRKMGDEDAGIISALCAENTQFYRYCTANPTVEQILDDLHALPQGVEASDKYYIGFYRDGALTAVMDLIDGYPLPDIAFIGFFMMNKAFQGRGIGTAIISDVAAALKSMGKSSIRLAIDKGNPQSTRFWEKNGFKVIKEVEQSGHALLIAEKTL